MKILVWLGIFGAAALAQTPRGQKPDIASPQEVVATTRAPVVSETLAAQVLLDRAGFSPGEIDGRSGANLARALTAFQRAHRLPETGKVDEATWQQLTNAGNAPLTTYELTTADVAGPFATTPGDLMAQAKLKALTYESALEAVAEKFHAGQALLRELNPSASFTAAGERIVVPNVEPFEIPARAAGEGTGRAARRGASGEVTARRTGSATSRRGAPPADAAREAVTIAVTKSTSSLTVEDHTGRVLFHAPVTSGSERDPLPIGPWKVTAVQRMPVFHYNPELFWDADPAHSKARIAPGPNNPVGVAWIGLTKEHYGIHGTPEPSRIGHVQSHGCVRLTNWDVARLMHWARAGTAVVFRE